jgi:hypothetical protein
MSPVDFPSDATVLQAIADLLMVRRSSAGLAHYPTLRIQTNNLHAALDGAMKRAALVVDEWSAKLADNTQVTAEFRPKGTALLLPYRTIAPFLVRNLHQTADSLLGYLCKSSRVQQS